MASRSDGATGPRNHCSWGRWCDQSARSTGGNMDKMGLLYRINRGYDNMREPWRFTVTMLAMVLVFTLTEFPGILFEHEMLGHIGLLFAGAGIIAVRALF